MICACTYDVLIYVYMRVCVRAPMICVDGLYNMYTCVWLRYMYKYVCV